jgi:hypothetical protein
MTKGIDIIKVYSSKKFCFLAYNAVWSTGSQAVFQRSMSLPSLMAEE